MEAGHSTNPVTKDSSPDIDLNDTLFSNEPQNIRKMVRSTPLPKLMGNDDKLTLPLKQEHDILSRERLLAEFHTDPDIIQFSKRALPAEEVIKIGECLYLKDGMTTT